MGDGEAMDEASSEGVAKVTCLAVVLALLDDVEADLEEAAAGGALEAVAAHQSQPTARRAAGGAHRCSRSPLGSLSCSIRNTSLPHSLHLVFDDMVDQRGGTRSPPRG